jgi:hypothetical protein
VPVKKSAMLHKWYERVLCCRAGEKERHAARLVKKRALLLCWLKSAVLAKTYII